MRIKRLEVDGFRCLVNFDIIFEEDLTVIVGENDSGKTSLLECLRVIAQNKPIEIDDFSHGKDTITLEIEVEDFIFRRAYKLSDECVEEDSSVAKPTNDYIERIDLLRNKPLK